MFCECNVVESVQYFINKNVTVTSILANFYIDLRSFSTYRKNNFVVFEDP